MNTPPTNRNRRNFVLSALAAPWAASCSAASRSREIWVSAQGGEESSFGAAWVEPGGAAAELPVGFRGHDVIQHPLRSDRIVLIARRPGRQMVEVDVPERRVVGYVDCAENYELGGHACFSRDGRVLFSAESNYERGEGRIVVRDADDYRVLGDFESHGVGPHEIALMPDDKTLVVANGGLLTHPSTGREVLNLDTMRSTLSFLNSETGELLDEVSVSESKASIRHLDVSDRGEVAVALQMQRAVVEHTRPAPLAAVFDSEHGLQVIDSPEQLLLSCDDYMGSTRVNSSARVAAFTSPRGDLAIFWSLDSRQLLGYHRFHDVCGITVALDQRQFVLSNSSGQVRCLDASSLEQAADQIDVEGFEWDNHLRAIEVPA